MKINAFYVFLSLFSILSARTQTPLQVLTTEYLETPLGIDIKTPRFSWQMETNPSKIGQFQTAYQILVFNESNIQVWDSGKIVSGNALAISYDGLELEPQTRYTWEVKVWDEEGKISTKRSWFETGLLDANPNSKQWNSAQWIGGGDADMVLNSQYLSVYKMEYSLQLDSKSKSTRASFVFGANDVRLMDKNKNIQGVANGRDENYVRFELDIAKVDGSENGLAQFNVFRLGYDSEDSSTVPFRSFKTSLMSIPFIPTVTLVFSKFFLMGGPKRTKFLAMMIVHLHQGEIPVLI